MRWDPNTHQLIGATEDVMAIHRTKKRKIFNISVKAAMKSMPEAAISSMYKELHQLLSKGVFIGIQPNFKHNKKVIKSFLFLKEKFKPDGSFDKLKSRLVAGGHMQNREEILYEDRNSPTASTLI
jgi:transcription elongation factor GreA-like protein